MPRYAFSATLRHAALCAAFAAAGAGAAHAGASMGNCPGLADKAKIEAAGPITAISFLAGIDAKTDTSAALRSALATVNDKPPAIRDPAHKTPAETAAENKALLVQQIVATASRLAVKLQKNGPLILLDANGCQWNVTSGKDLLALWSIAPEGFKIYSRPPKSWPGNDANALLRTAQVTQDAPLKQGLVVRQPDHDTAFAGQSYQDLVTPAAGDGGSRKTKDGKGCWSPVDLVAHACEWKSADTPEDISLSYVARLRDTISGPSISIGPPKSGSGGGPKSTASYDYNATATIARVYRWDCARTEEHGCPGLLGDARHLQDFSSIIAPFLSVWYENEKNPAVSGPSANVQIDRFAVGTAIAATFGFDDFDPQTDCPIPADKCNPRSQSDVIALNDQTIAFAAQLIPQFVTDHRFEAKVAYLEGRMDIVQLPRSWFTNICFRAPYDGVDDGTLGEFGNLTCGVGLITDYAHQFRPGLQLALANDFARLGFDTGVTYQPFTPCDSNPKTDLCNWLKGIKLQMSYRNLWDYEGEHANVHRFHGALKYTIPGGGDDDDGGGSKGLTIGLEYTDGIEDITLIKIPSWKLSLSGDL